MERKWVQNVAFMVERPDLRYCEVSVIYFPEIL